jgi:glycosyltransferase involved in cell wall biosynthesis
MTPKILFVTSNTDEFGGAELCLFRLATEVRRHGYAVSVLMRMPNRLVQPYAEAGIPLTIHPFFRLTKRGGPFALLAAVMKSILAVAWFVRLYRRERPDVVHVNDLIDLLPALAARLAGRRVVYHIRMIRGGAVQRRLMSLLVRLVSDTSLCVSAAVRRAYHLDRSFRRHRSLVVHDWADPALTDHPRGECPVEFRDVLRRVVMIGRITEWKGQGTFVEAAGLVRQIRPDAGFFLVGGASAEPADQDFVQKVFARAGQNGVRYLGARSDVASLLQWADASVHASLAPDPFPNVVLESLQFGVPTVGANGGGVPEMILHGKTGLLVNPGDARALADAILGLLGDEEMRNRFSAAGRRHVGRLCDQDAIVATIVGVYVGLAGAGVDDGRVKVDLHAGIGA